MEARLLDIEWPEFGSGKTARTPGTHLTDVIEDLARTSGLHDKDMKWDKHSTFMAGFLWEEVLAYVLGPLISPRVGEVCLDGIIGTPDGLCMSDWLVDEYKFTWKSVNHSPLDNWRYMTQLMGYCKMVGVTQARLWIYHCVGDWKGSGPERRIWLITFQPHEIEENWAMIRNHAEMMRRKDNAG